MKGSIFWAIQLAFVDKGVVQFSIIYLPKIKKLYYGLRGKGVYLNYKKINREFNVPLNESIVEFCGSIHKKYNDKKDIFSRLLNNEVRPAGFMHINTCAFAFTNLLSGRSDTLVISTNKPWDVLPGMFLVEEMGIKSYDYKDIKVYSATSGIEEFLKD